MAEKPPVEPPQFRLPDPALVTRTMSEVAERGQRIVTDFLKRQATDSANPDPLNIGGAFLRMGMGATPFLLALLLQVGFGMNAFAAGESGPLLR